MHKKPFNFEFLPVLHRWLGEDTKRVVEGNDADCPDVKFSDHVEALAWVISLAEAWEEASEEATAAVSGVESGTGSDQLHTQPTQEQRT